MANDPPGSRVTPRGVLLAAAAAVPAADLPPAEIDDLGEEIHSSHSRCASRCASLKVSIGPEGETATPDGSSGGDESRAGPFVGCAAAAEPAPPWPPRLPALCEPLSLGSGLESGLPAELRSA